MAKRISVTHGESRTQIHASATASEKALLRTIGKELGIASESIIAFEDSEGDVVAAAYGSLEDGGEYRVRVRAPPAPPAAAAAAQPRSARGLDAPAGVGGDEPRGARDASPATAATRGGAAASCAQEEWAARAAAADGNCLVCLQYFGHTDGLCSVCHSFVRSLRMPWEAVARSYSPEALLEAVGQVPAERESRAARDLGVTTATLDRVAQQLAPSPQAFQHLLRSLRCREVSPNALARELLSFGRPLMTASQAAQLLELLQGRGETDYRYYHVLCSRVVDPWNLSTPVHGIGHCYYGYFSDFRGNGDELAKLIGATDQDTLAAVFWRLLHARVNFEEGIPQWTLNSGGAFVGENFWSEADVQFVREDMRQHAVDVVPDLVLSCELREGALRCTTMTGAEVGSFEVPQGEDPFGRWLWGEIATAMPAGRPRERVCLVKSDGTVLLGQGPPTAFEEFCSKMLRAHGR